MSYAGDIWHTPVSQLFISVHCLQKTEIWNLRRLAYLLHVLSLLSLCVLLNQKTIRLPQASPYPGQPLPALTSNQPSISQIITFNPSK
ncbi:hypothetical protein Ddc_10176 [Ditylenchus destructor]|nr:hypothetical protein Ddc_10176 [Ditylenchus destructor]